MRNERLVKQSNKLRIRFMMMQLQHDLQAPSEAICHDRKTDGELAAIRFRNFQGNGSDRFLPYENVVSAGNHAANATDRESDTSMDHVRNASPEAYWNKHLPVVCGELAHDQRNGTYLGAHFRNNPEDFGKYVRPYLIRLLEAHDPKVSLSACDALWAAGDRSDQLREIATALAKAGNMRPEVKRVMETYDLSLDAEPGQDGLMTQTDDDRKQIHSIVSAMKTKHPVTSETIIRDWR